MYNETMNKTSDLEQEITKIEAELASIDQNRKKLLSELSQLRQQVLQKNAAPQLSLNLQTPTIDKNTSQAEKISLFRALFRGREDVFPRRFENRKTGKSGFAPVCRNEWKTGICQKPKISCQKCNHREFVPISDEIIRNHLIGSDPNDHSSRDFTIGVYPLLTDETCWFLAVDFDKATWADDAKAFMETCESYQIPAALERSRSGNGGHVWIFFETAIPAVTARKLGTLLLTKTMNRRPEIGMDSYDRFFPSQDTMPKGGFGNLIALPLQKKPRAMDNSVFIDINLIPHPDQWTFLSSLQKLSITQLNQIIQSSDDENDYIGIRTVVLDENEAEPWKLSPSREYKEPIISGDLPEQINITLGNQVFIEKENLPAPLRNRLIRLAAFQNPEFFKAQAMRFSTFGKPRVISCCEDFPKHLALPRGCLDELVQLIEDLDITANIEDERQDGLMITAEFQGKLRPEQHRAAKELLKHDIGVLSATTAFGKTVIGAWLIAQRRVNTLVIVHRRQLMDQWVERLELFLGMDKKQIGQIGGGKQKAMDTIDVAMIQSLIHKGTVKDIIGNYGQIIVDECHHISAASFEQVIRQAKAKYVTGLSATVTRQDGHHPIIFMQCGPVRYRVSARKQAASRAFMHKVVVRNTNFELATQWEAENKPAIQEIYIALVKDTNRNQMIINDVIATIKDGRSPVLLTERRKHLDFFTNAFRGKIQNIIVLSGGMGKKQRTKLMDQLHAIPKDEERLIIATGRYLGEGFDDARLDTLFLALPVAWHGTITQYAGRLHRDYDGKSEVTIYDYVDDKVPVLAAMFKKRERGYKSIGYSL